MSFFSEIDNSLTLSNNSKIMHRKLLITDIPQIDTREILPREDFTVSQGNWSINWQLLKY